MSLLPLVSWSQHAFLWLPSKCSLPDSVLLSFLWWAFCVWGFLSCCGCYNSKPFFLPCALLVSPLEFRFLLSGKTHVSVHLFVVLSVCFVLLFYAFYLVQFTCLLVCFTFLSDDGRKPYLLINRYSFNKYFVHG